MTEVEPVEAAALVVRDARSVVPPGRSAATRRSRSRGIVASGVRALSTGPLLPASALAAAAWTAARVVARAARRGRVQPAPVAAEAAVGRVLGPPAAGPALEISWTRVEIRWRP